MKIVINRVLFLIISLIFSVLFNGCGGDLKNERRDQYNNGETAHEIIQSEVVKIERADWNNVPPLIDGFFATNENETLSFKLKSPQIESNEAFSEIIFIDADNNKETGYSNVNTWGEVGAEYLVQGNSLFGYSGTGWQWEFIARVNRNANNNLTKDERELEFDTSLVNLEKTIKITPFLLNKDWVISNRFNSVEYSLKNVDNNINNFNISDNQNSITFQLQSKKIANNEIRTEAIFIDVDNNLATGYNNLANWHSQLGAEYLIQGGILFRYSGNGNGWSWNVVGRVNSNTNGELLSIELNKGDLENLSQTFNSTAYLLNNNWMTVQRFTMVSHTGIEVQQPQDHGVILVSHDLNNFNIGLNGDLIKDSVDTEIFIDVDQNSDTGFKINKIGAEYKVSNNELSRFVSNRWNKITTRGINRFNNPNVITTFIPRWRVRSGRNIAISANILENGNIIYTYPTINYEVRGDDDEITLSLDEPNFYIFTIHSPLIGVGKLGEKGNGEVKSAHIAMDWDNSLATGHYMNDLGAEAYMGSWDGALNRYVGPRTAAWWIQFQRGNRGEIDVSVGEHTITFKVPRDMIRSENGIIRVASTLNNTKGHFYWTNGYEFNLKAK